MAADDQAILVTHQPRWLSDWFWDETACHNLRQLVRGHLKGRARVHLAGALQCYLLAAVLPSFAGHCMVHQPCPVFKHVQWAAHQIRHLITFGCPPLQQSSLSTSCNMTCSKATDSIWSQQPVGQHKMTVRVITWYLRLTTPSVYTKMQIQTFIPWCSFPAGDLHFYMRHSFRPFQAAPAQPAQAEAAKEASMQPDFKAASQAASVVSQSSGSSSSHYVSTGMAEPAVSSAVKGGQALSGQPVNGLRHNHSFNFAPSMHAVPAGASNGSAKHAQHGTGAAASGSTAVHLRVSTGRQPSQVSMAEPASASYASSSTSATSAEDIAELQSRRQSGDGASTSGQSTSSGWHPHDPEHLIVNGLGGAFLHPTHVFSPSRFVSGALTSLGIHACHPVLTGVHQQI